MIRMIALDLDGTTLMAGGRLSAANKAVLEEAIRRGLVLAVASGRSYHSLPPDIRQVRGLTYSINSNGASVYRLSDGQRLYHDPVRSDRVPGILRILTEADCGIECFVDGVAYASREFVEHPERFGATPQGCLYIKATRRPVDDIVTFIQANADQLDAVDGVTKHPEQKAQIKEGLARLGGVYVTSSVPHLVEIASETAGKEQALRWLADRLQVKANEVMAFGNAENDLGMLSWAGLGVAVANSEELLLRAADYVTAANDRDGVALAIQKFVFNQEVPDGKEGS